MVVASQAAVSVAVAAVASRRDVLASHLAVGGSQTRPAFHQIIPHKYLQSPEAPASRSPQQSHGQMSIHALKMRFVLPRAVRIRFASPLWRARARSIVRNKLLERAKQLPPGRSQFIAVRQRHAPQLALARRRKLHEHLPPIYPAPGAPNQPAFLQAIHQLDGAVMLNLQALRKNADGGFL